MSVSARGYLLIADITGYTMYLSRSELDHAQKVLKALIELLIGHSGPPLVVSKLEGDAILSYALLGAIPAGQTFVEVIESSYVSFRHMINLLVLNNRCQCNACANISQLDLKFFVHFGEFIVQKVDGREELVGSDVILVHRLLKNNVAEDTGLAAYALYTDAAIRALGLGDYTQQLISHQENYDHIGPVNAWVQDMGKVWEARQAETHIAIGPENTVLEVATDIAMPPELVWSYLSEPEFRNVVIGSTRQEIHNKQNGRVAPGTVYQCYHGERLTNETIVQWRPFQQITSEDTMPLPNTYAYVDFQLTPTPTGTHLIQKISKSTGPWPFRKMCDIAVRRMTSQGQIDIDNFRDRIEADVAQRGLAHAIGVVFDEQTEALALAQDLSVGM